MRIGVVYSGEWIQPRIFRGFYSINRRVNCVADTSIMPEDRERVEEFVDFFKCDSYKDPKKMFETERLDGVIIESGARASVNQIELIELALSAGVHVLLPTPPSSLAEGVRIAAIAEMHNNRIVMTGTRLMFGACFQEILPIISRSTFGTIQDMRFLLGTGRYTDWRAFLLSNAVNCHFQLAFELAQRFMEAPALPEEVAVLASRSGAPNITSIVQFPDGELTTFCMTSNRQWSNDSYHTLEITGGAAYIWSNLQTWRCFSDNNTFRIGGSDDEMSGKVYGSAGQLQEFCSAIDAKRTPDAGDLKRLFPALWFRDLLIEGIENRQTHFKIATRQKTLAEKIEQLDAELVVDLGNKVYRRDKALAHAQCGEFATAISEYRKTL